LVAVGKRYACQFVQVVCTAPGPILVERYERRARSGERHPGHTDAASLDEWRPRLLTQRWDALELDGPVFIVDTTDWRVDLDALVRGITAAVRHVGVSGVPDADPAARGTPSPLADSVPE
jgi:hypothetical protein